MEFVGFGFGGAGHAGEFFVHAEVVLDGDGGEGLGFAFDFDALFGFDGLMEAVAPAASGHEASGVFVDDDDLVVLDNVVDVFLVDGVGADELVDGVDAFVAHGVVVLNGAAFFHELFGGEVVAAVEFGHVGDHVGEDVHFGIVGVEFGAAFFG